MKQCNQSQPCFMVLTAIWTIFIWYNSFCIAPVSSMNSSHVEQMLTPLLDIFCIPQVMRQFLVRKTAHFTEFAVLGFLWSRVFHGKQLYIPFVLSVLTAVVDESIQRFVPGRSGQMKDVLIDSAGAATALCAAMVSFGSCKQT